MLEFRDRRGCSACTRVQLRDSGSDSPHEATLNGVPLCPRPKVAVVRHLRAGPGFFTPADETLALCYAEAISVALQAAVRIQGSKRSSNSVHGRALALHLDGA